MPSNNLLKYTSRDYNSIKSDLLSAINSVTSNWTSREDSDPGIMLLNLMAYLGDNLSFNLDMQALEMYFPTATQRKNIKKLLSLLGYKVHWYRSAIVDVSIYNNSANNISIDTNIYSVDANNRLTTINNDINYIILPVTDGVGNDNIVNIGGYETQQFIAVQGNITYMDISENDINNNRFYLMDTNVDEGHLYLYSMTKDENSNTPEFKPWQQVDDVTLVQQYGRYFEFNTDEYDSPYIRLVDYWQNCLTNDSSGSVSLRLYYILSNGADGNIMDNAFTGLYNTPTFTDGSTDLPNLIYTNYNNYNTTTGHNQSGYNPQTAEEARKDAKNYINTFDTLVTISDFEKFMLQDDKGFDASLAIDVQRAMNLNEDIFNTYPIIDDSTDLNSTNVQNNIKRIKQYVCGYGYLITNETALSGSFDDAVSTVYRKIESSDLNNAYTGNQQIPEIVLNETSIDKYQLNIYGIYDNYNPTYLGIVNTDEWNYPANPENSDIQSFINGTGDVVYPYRRYKVSDEIIEGADGTSGIRQKLLEAKIMNVEVNFAECRVFDWRAVGTIYLKKPVLQSEGDNIIINVVNQLAAKFTSGNVGFGNKISYIDVIETIQNADSRIRYFEAGRDGKKLVDWSTKNFDVDNYFNPISIMRFNQYSIPNPRQSTVNEIAQFNTDEDGNPLLTIASSSIISD